MERQNLETLNPEINNEEEEISKSSLAVMRTNKYIRMLALCASLYMPISCSSNNSIVNTASAAVAKTPPETDTDKGEELSAYIDNLADRIHEEMALDNILYHIKEEYALKSNKHARDYDNIQNLKRLLDPEIKDWIEKISNEYELTLKDYNDLHYLLDYYDSQMKEGLLSNAVKNIFKKNKTNGITYNAEGLLYLFVEYQNPSLRDFLDILKNKYEIGFKDVSGEFIFINLLGRINCLEDLDKKTTYSKYINFIKRFNFKQNKDSLQTFLMLNKNPLVYDKLLSQAFGEFLKEFNQNKYIKNPNKFINSSIDSLSLLLQAFEINNFFQKIETLNKEFDNKNEFLIKNADDILLTILFSKNTDLISTIKTPGFKKVWKYLKKRNLDEDLSKKNLLNVCHLFKNGFSFEKLYEEEFSDFLRTSFEREYFSLNVRIQLYNYFKNDNLKNKILSADFKNTKVNFKNTRKWARIKPFIGVNSIDIDLILFFMDHPDLIKKYHEVTEPSEDISIDARELLLRFLPSFLLLENNQKVKEYKKILEKNLPYQFHWVDGPKILEMSKTWPDEKDFSEMIEETGDAMKEDFLFNSEEFRLNDLFYMFFDIQSFHFNNLDILKKEFSTVFKNDIHRIDSSFQGYNSYNKLDNFNVFELNKIFKLQKELNNRPELRAYILEHIDEDIKERPDTELGGVISLNDNGGIEFEYHEPRVNIDNNNISYGLTSFNSPFSFAMFHQHAISYNDAHYGAGPSGTINKTEGDLGYSKLSSFDGVVIASIKKGQFAVHFFNDRGDVVFVGLFEE